MIGLGKVTYYNQDGTMDWLRTIVRSVYVFTEKRTMTMADIDTGEHFNHDEDIIHIESIAAARAQRLYYKKTDIQTLYRSKYHG